MRASPFPLLPPLHGHEQDQQLPSTWRLQLQELFDVHAAVAHEEEGPIAFVTTWLLVGSNPHSTEESRALRLDQHAHLWLHDIIELWRDQLDHAAPIEIVLVHPEPPRHDTTWVLGHLIVYQRVVPPAMPTLLTLNFRSDRRTGLNYVAAVLVNPSSVNEIVALCHLERFCTTRSCDVQNGGQRYVQDAPIPLHCGIGLVFNIHPPVPADHIGDDHVVDPPILTVDNPALEEDLDDVPDLTGQSHFVRELYEHYDSLARPGPAHLERLLHVTTWCLRGDRLRLNGEQRIVTLGDDFYRWEGLLRHRWLDRLDHDGLVEFTVVIDPPPTSQTGANLHIIVYQFVPHIECANLVTIHDDPVLSYTTAAVLPVLLLQHQLLVATQREHDCPPFNSQATCTTWQVGRQFDNIRPIRNEHGLTFLVIIQRLAPDPWTIDDDTPDPTATSSTSLLQIQARLCKGGQGRLTTGQVAHTQWPVGTPISLAELIPPPTSINVDFSTVFYLENDFQAIFLALDQPWPDGVEVPSETISEFATLQPPNTEQPRAYHFYTDGSRRTSEQVGSAVILIVETDLGFHYGGCLYKRIRQGTTAYDGENGAITWALLWAIKLSDHHWNETGTVDILFTYNFDSTSAGFLAAGYWRTAVAIEWRIMMRSLAQVLQSRHGISNLHWNHIKAHSGHPWNEAADRLAGHAATLETTASTSVQWEAWLSNPDKLLALQWLWYKELMEAADPRVPTLHNGCLRCIVPNPQQSNTPGPQAFAPTTSTATSTWTHIAFTIATANVLTMGPHAVTRHQLLMRQFHDAQCAIVGLQETRHRHVSCFNNEYYHILDHPCTPDGQDGIQLWISKKLPLTENGDLVPKSGLRIIASSPAFLLAKIRLPTWTCAILTCRAPHSGRPWHEANHFWTHLNTIIAKKVGQLPLFFAGDANAHVGAHPTESVGDLAPQEENQAGAFFHTWLINHSMFAPATFESCHPGHEHNTFVAPDGQRESRIDYIALPLGIQYDSVYSSVSEEVDLSLQRCDHRPVICRIKFQHCGRRAVPRSRSRPDLEHLARNLQTHDGLVQFHNAMSTPPWSLPVHESAQWLESSAQQALHSLVPLQQKWRRKIHISTATWELVDRKKFLFKQSRATKRALRMTMVKACFIGWKNSTATSSAHGLEVMTSLQRDLPAWLRLTHAALAINEHQLGILSRQVQLAIQQEDSAYYQQLAERSSTLYSVEGLTGLWKHLRALLPKHRQRLRHMPRDMDSELLAHFTHLEAGFVTDGSTLRSTCLERNQGDHDAKPRHMHVELSELPTLTEIEMLCLKQKSRKAPGPDGIPSDLCRQGAVAVAPHLHSVICKSLLHATEPLIYKGGYLCAIYKGKGSVDEASGYRGILLANTFAKVAHAWSRHRLLPTLQQRKTIGQLGGLPSQQTCTGVHIIKLHSVVANEKKLTTATLFIDLRSAFHHMLRELVFATSNGLLRTTLSQFLDEKDFDLDQIHRNLDELCSQHVSDIPHGLRQFLHDLHHHTWFQLPAQQATGEFVHTHRGTRPGSPMADIGFNLMMSVLLKEVQSELLQNDSYRAGAEALGTFVPPTAWVDDIAVPLTTATPSAMLPLLEHTVQIVHHAFQQRGLTMNLDAGKSEIVLMFRGPGSVPLRRQVFVRPVHPTLTVSTSTHVLTVRIVSSYRHLGVKFAMNLEMDREIRSRVGAARQAFHQMKKPIFANSLLPIPAKIALFQSLVLSRLLYGCAVWTELSTTSLRHVEALVTDCYRQIHGIGFWTPENLPDAAFYRKHGLQSFKVFWARTRLCYLQNLAKFGITAHKALLLTELTTGKGWLYELQADLHWMSDLVQLPFPVPHDRQSWISTWALLRDMPSWKASVSRAAHRHILQEQLAYHVQQYHDDIIAELQRYGMHLNEPLREDAHPAAAHRCFQCEMAFPTAQQLAVHAYKIHGRRAQESQYVQSEVCPGCLRNFHTTYRVVQHLRHRPNGCWDRIVGVRTPGEPACVKLQPHLAGVHRLPAIREHHGPLRPTSIQRQIHSVQQEIQLLDLEGAQDFAWWDPETEPALLERCLAGLDSTLATWISSQEPSEETFHNVFFETLFSFPIHEFKAARVFIFWIETAFYDTIQQYVTYPAYPILEQAHMTFLEDLHTWQQRSRMSSLRRQLVFLQTSGSKAPLPHRPRPAVSRPARLHRIDTSYACMAALEDERRAWTMSQRPARTLTPVQGPYYIIHMFSGRRRSNDFHEYMQHYVNAGPMHLRASILVLSIDTAIDQEMNIHQERVWSFLIGAARAGRILALLLGPPCETWSVARFAQIFDETGLLQPGPRPLRGDLECWGLHHLTSRELAQLDVGNSLFLKGLWLCCPVALCGGSVLLEHPAPDYDLQRPSIWRTGIMRLLLRGGWLFRRVTFRQGHFGAAGVKPTTLLHSNCPIVEILAEDAQPDTVVEEELIGRDAKGQFRTSKAKEYPPRLCQSFAKTFWRQIASKHCQPNADAFDPVAIEFAALSDRVDPISTWLPDYQPKR